MGNILQYIQIAEELISVYDELKKDGTIDDLKNAIDSEKHALDLVTNNPKGHDLLTKLKGLLSKV